MTPILKNKQRDIITTEEWLELLDLAGKLDFSKAWQTPPTHHWLSCVIAIDWLFGKRINEILQLKRREVYFTHDEVNILFHVGKKKHRTDFISLQPYLKVKTVEHKAVPFVREYLEEYDREINKPEGYLFPANTEPYTRNVKTAFLNKQGNRETRSYRYQMSGGYGREETARAWLEKINLQRPKTKRVWFHLGRHTIGTRMARLKKSTKQIALALDSSERTALVYSQRAGDVAEEWTREVE